SSGLLRLAGRPGGDLEVRRVVPPPVQVPPVGEHPDPVGPVETGEDLMPRGRFRDRRLADPEAAEGAVDAEPVEVGAVPREPLVVSPDVTPARPGQQVLLPGDRHGRHHVRAGRCLFERLVQLGWGDLPVGAVDDGVRVLHRGPVADRPRRGWSEREALGVGVAVTEPVEGRERGGDLVERPHRAGFTGEGADPVAWFGWRHGPAGFALPVRLWPPRGFPQVNDRVGHRASWAVWWWQGT